MSGLSKYKKAGLMFGGGFFIGLGIMFLLIVTPFYYEANRAWAKKMSDFAYTQGITLGMAAPPFEVSLAFMELQHLSVFFLLIGSVLGVTGIYFSTER